MKKSPRWVLRGILCGLALPMLAACTTTIPPVSPTPNTAFVPQQRSLELALAPEVADRFSVEIQQPGMYYAPIVIQSWHTTLENGFRNGFRSAFPARQGPSADLTLRIDRASLELGDFFPHVHARIQYVATLSGADGTLRRTAGVAYGGVPRGRLVSGEDLIAGDISTSVAAMYEQVAMQLLADPRPAPRAAGCVPGQSSACVGPKGCQGFQVCASDGAHYEPCSCGS